MRELISSLYLRLAAARREDGQTFVEYALVLTLVAVAVSVLVAWTNLDNSIGTQLQNVANHL